MRVRHPPRTLALILTLSLLAALALSACGAPQDQPALPGMSGNPGIPGPEVSPGPPVINHAPTAVIMVSSGVMSVDEPLSIKGAGFIPGEPVTLSLVIDNIVSYAVGGPGADQPVANSTGTFAVSFDSIRGGGGERGALDRAPGPRSIRAEGEDGSRASFPVMITSADAPYTSVSSSLVAFADTVLNDETGGLDTTITAAGAAFTPGEAVTVTIVSLVDGADKILVGITAKDSGEFEVSSTLHGAAPAEGADPEMPIAPGIYTILAEGASGSMATGVLIVEQNELPKADQDEE